MLFFKILFILTFTVVSEVCFSEIKVATFNSPYNEYGLIYDSNSWQPIPKDVSTTIPLRKDTISLMNGNYKSLFVKLFFTFKQDERLSFFPNKYELKTLKLNIGDHGQYKKHDSLIALKMAKDYLKDYRENKSHIVSDVHVSKEYDYYYLIEGKFVETYSCGSFGLFVLPGYYRSYFMHVLISERGMEVPLDDNVKLEIYTEVFDLITPVYSER